MPGFGLSQRNLKDLPSSREQCEEFYMKFYDTSVNLVKSVIETNKIDLAGHSYGGYLSSIYYINNIHNQQEHDIRKLILLSPFGIKKDIYRHLTDEE